MKDDPEIPEQPEILQQIDACRPGSRDLQEPEMAGLAARLCEDARLRGLYARVQQFDAAVRSAVQDVPVPEGLAQRLLARVQAAAAAATTNAVEVESPALREPALVPASVTPRAQRRTSRGMMGYAIGIAAALLLAAGLVAFYPRGEQLSAERLCEAAVARYDADLASPPSGGDVVALADAKAEFPYPSDGLIRPKGMSARRIRDLLDQDGLAYSMSAGGTHATLYVLHMNVEGLPDRPPLSPQSTTGGRAAAVWQNGDSVYVLVVEGGEREYQAFLRPQIGVA